jgi:hypothetical protein
VRRSPLVASASLTLVAVLATPALASWTSEVAFGNTAPIQLVRPAMPSNDRSRDRSSNDRHRQHGDHEISRFLFDGGTWRRKRLTDVGFPAHIAVAIDFDPSSAYLGVAWTRATGGGSVNYVRFDGRTAVAARIVSYDRGETAIRWTKQI